MPRVLATLLAPPFLFGCAPSLESGRVAVVSVFARYDRAGTARVVGPDQSGAATVGVTLGTASPPPPQRLLVVDEPLAPAATEPGSPCAHAALCAWESHATRSALVRLRLAGGLE